MRLPNTAHTSRPWRIHELTADFRLVDVWVLPTPGGPNDFPRLVQLMASRDPSQGSSRAVRTLFAIRWKVGKLLGWDGPDAGHGSARPSLRDRLPVDLRNASSGPASVALPFTSLYLIDDEPDRSRRDAHRLGSRRDRWLQRPDGRLREAKRTARDRLHGRDRAVPAPDRVPTDDARARAGLAGARRRAGTGARVAQGARGHKKVPVPTMNRDTVIGLLDRLVALTDGFAAIRNVDCHSFPGDALPA